MRASLILGNLLSLEEFVDGLTSDLRDGLAGLPRLRPQSSDLLGVETNALRDDSISYGLHRQSVNDEALGESFSFSPD